MTQAEIEALAARMTLADLVAVNRAVLERAWPPMQYAGIVGHVAEGVPDLYLPVTAVRPFESSPQRPLLPS